MTTPVTFNARIRTVRLPQPGVIPSGPAALAGWGSTGTTAATILQRTTKPIISIPECRNAINALGFDGSLVDYTNLCTGPLTGGVAACSG